jgi:hypothetical protein
MNSKKVPVAWLIGEHDAIRKYSMGMAKPAPLPLGPYISNGYLKKASSIPDLARQIGVNPEALDDTVKTFNTYADKGHDPDFQRGDDAYSVGMSDPTHKPNASLGPLRKGPFYAVELRRGELSTLNGLNANENAQVLKDDGDVIKGLYAAGVDANSVFRGAYPGGGSSIGPAMTFGYIAARHIAGASGSS